MNELDKIKVLIEKNPFHYSKMIKNNKELVVYVNNFDGVELKEKIYNAINGNTNHDCKACGKQTPFITVVLGYREYCNAKCQKDFLVIDREQNAIDKINSFGNFEYISGYIGSHSLVKVKNKNCNCVFDVTYLNLFTNENYCPTHGIQNRTNKMIERNKLGLTEISKEKRKNTFEDKRNLKIDQVNLNNEILANEILLEGRDFVIEFLKEILIQHKSGSDNIISRFPKIFKMIKTHYGERFGQKLYNFIHKIDSKENHPKCLECHKFVNYKIYSNRYSTFCSKNCKCKSNLVKDKMEATCIERYGVRHPMQNKEILEKNWDSQYRLKSIELKSGKIVKLMGYEPQVLDHLLKTEFKEEDFSFDVIPTFKYGDKKLYFPDFYLPNYNLIIEVKSEWTLQLSPETIAQKQAAVEDAGYVYRLIVWPLSNQEPLGVEFEKVLYENLWNLYES